jgi:hypothetical protein
MSGDDEQATALFAESQALFRRLGARTHILISLVNQGYMSYRRGDLAGMAACFREGLVLSAEVGNKVHIAEHIGGLAGAIGMAGRPELAARLFGAADALLDTIGQTRDPIDKPDHERVVTAVSALLDNAIFEAARRTGRAMAPEQAIAEALAASDPASRLC